MSNLESGNVVKFSGDIGPGEDPVTSDFLDAVHANFERKKQPALPLEWIRSGINSDRLNPSIMAEITDQIRYANHLTTDQAVINRDREVILAKICNEDPSVEILLSPQQAQAYDGVLDSSTLKIVYEFFTTGDIKQEGRPSADVVFLHPDA